jgi:hypothetical protein
MAPDWVWDLMGVWLKPYKGLIDPYRKQVESYLMTCIVDQSK